MFDNMDENIITVYSQEEFECHYKHHAHYNIIGFTLLLSSNRVVSLRGNSRANLYGNSSAVLRGNSRAVLYDNSSADLYDNSSADLYGNSSAVLYDNSSADLYDNSSADLYDNSSAVLYDNSSADLYDNSSAVLRGNSSAVLYDFAVIWVKSNDAEYQQVSSRSYVQFIRWPKDMTDWCDMKGIEVVNGKILLYKATDINGFDFYSGKINYDTDDEIVAPDWDPEFSGECGCGLHLANNERSALSFVSNNAKYRVFQVEANIGDCQCYADNPQYPMKIRARACRRIKEIDAQTL